MNFLHSWKTTLFGVILFLQSLLATISHIIDNDPTTNPNWDALISTFIAMIALFFAKDADRTGTK